MLEQSAPNIMLLDDEPFMIKLLGSQLENFGFSVSSAFTSGRAAINAMIGPLDPPDLILLDLNMPEMDGLEFVRHLAAQNFKGGVVLISGEDERMREAASTLVRAHSVRLLGHLQKPVTNEALQALLQSWSPNAAPCLRATPECYDAKTLGEAIANGELVNHYQPKVAMSDGRVVGVETLVRWRHRVDGLVFPDRFIGVAERHGLIDRLTQVVLRQALTDHQVWRAAGHALRIAVNVSMTNLTALNFPDFFVAAASAANVPPSDIVLEVTESQLMADLRAPLEILTRLRLNRFALSIDDFGTGHSSLTQLRDIPFDELKIDRGFVHRAWSDSTRHAIFQASLNLARQLRMQVVAEGVEDEHDWDFLRGTHCDIAQGYFIARPMPADELPGWIASWKERLRANQGLLS